MLKRNLTSVFSNDSHQIKRGTSGVFHVKYVAGLGPGLGAERSAGPNEIHDLCSGWLLDL